METESAIKLLVEKYQCFVARDAVFPDVFFYDPMIKNLTLFYDFDDNKHKKTSIVCDTGCRGLCYSRVSV